MTVVFVVPTTITAIGVAIAVPAISGVAIVAGRIAATICSAILLALTTILRALARFIATTTIHAVVNLSRWSCARALFISNIVSFLSNRSTTVVIGTVPCGDRCWCRKYRGDRHDDEDFRSGQGTGGWNPTGH